MLGPQLSFTKTLSLEMFVCLYTLLHLVFQWYLLLHWLCPWGSQPIQERVRHLSHSHVGFAIDLSLGWSPSFSWAWNTSTGQYSPAQPCTFAMEMSALHWCQFTLWYMQIETSHILAGFYWKSLHIICAFHSSQGTQIFVSFSPSGQRNQKRFAHWHLSAEEKNQKTETAASQE